MAKQLYEVYNPQPDARLVIERLNTVIREYQAARYVLTVRQLYYQMIARDLFPETWVDPQSGTKNNIKNYKKLVNLLGKARMGGMIDWSAIEDLGRNLREVTTWDSPAAIMRAVAAQFRLDLWDSQPNYLQVWVEKEALSGVVERACTPLRVPWMACKGYMSLSEIRAQGLALKLLARNKDICIIHLGDHDPSGIAMTDDVANRLSIFAETPIKVLRIALNMDQIEQYNPPTNPAKESDPRFADYEQLFGQDAWELDALDPPVIVNLITETVLQWRDETLWKIAKREEDYEKSVLQAASDHWGDVKEHLESIGAIEEIQDEDEDDDEDG